MTPLSDSTIIGFVPLNIALVIFVLGLVVHWIRRVNKVFLDFEKLRYENQRQLLEVKAELESHIAVSDRVWGDVGRRLNWIEGQPSIPFDPERRRPRRES